MTAAGSVAAESIAMAMRLVVAHTIAPAFHGRAFEYRHPLYPMVAVGNCAMKQKRCHGYNYAGYVDAAQHAGSEGRFMVNCKVNIFSADTQKSLNQPRRKVKNC